MRREEVREATPVEHAEHVPCLDETLPGNLDPLRLMAKLLWSNDYNEELKIERQLLTSMGLIESAQLLRQDGLMSTYARQRRGDQEKLMDQALRQAHEHAATALRQHNMRYHSFSVCARSVSKLLRRVPYKDWKEASTRRECGLLPPPCSFACAPVWPCACLPVSCVLHADMGSHVLCRILSRPSVFKLLRFMVDLMPPPSFLPAKMIQLFCYDQCNARDGYTDTRRYAAERIDASGNSVLAQDVTYITSFRIFIPQALVNLTDRDVARFRKRGPFARDWSALVPFLQPSRVKEDLWKMFEEVAACMRRKLTAHGPEIGVNELQPAQVARMLYERNQVDPGGKTPIQILPVILDCDTASHQDTLRIWSHLEQHLEPCV